MNEEKITIDYKEWQEIMRDYDYQTKQANEYLLEAQKYACDVYVDVLERINQELQQQNQKYKEVIDKAIEYINLIVLGETLNGELILFKEEAEGQYLLDILNEVE